MNILFLCTGNSCRSQMAEGWARKMAGSLVDVRSAGIEAHGMNPRAVAVMKESGVDIGAQSSRVLTDGMLDWADVVVTVCGHADEACPALPAGTRKFHWPVEDPARAEGSEDEILTKFRSTRRELRERVRYLLRDLGFEVWT